MKQRKNWKELFDKDNLVFCNNRRGINLYTNRDDYYLTHNKKCLKLIHDCLLLLNKRDRARVRKKVLFFYFKYHPKKTVGGSCANLKKKSIIVITNNIINAKYFIAIWCILHEIGHFILGHNGIGLQEKEADEYAHKILNKFRR